ncbi:hypothetical protein LEP1GSC074_2680 [Leptospira noguchii str. Hook]|nr:hypothetical protein LEP1GSC074_2680 [Leptospira noguchii str. Hook]
MNRNSSQEFQLYAYLDKYEEEFTVQWEYMKIKSKICNSSHIFEV